jgi:hypothetical protein
MSETSAAAPSLSRLRDLVAAEGEAIAPALGASAPGKDALGPLVRAVARDGRDADEYALVIECVLEGYLLHFARPRLLDTPDQDLRLLAGDYMYALGLSRLARLADLDAVRALADMITLSARHHATAPACAERTHELAALWSLTAMALGDGPWPAYEPALAGVRAGEADVELLRAVVFERASETGVKLEAERALIAFLEVASAEPRT